jgi:membrane fusion protein, adhesin transport system
MTDTSMTTPSAARGLLDPQWLAGRGRLAQSIRLEEQGPDRLARAAIGILVAAIAGFVLWAAVTEVGEIAPASGEVTPVGLVKRIQHLEGGIVSAINVREGDLVDEGQVLLELESGTVSPDLEQLRARFAALELQQAQLRAIGNNETSRIEAKNGRFGHLAAAQETLLRSKRDALEAQEAVLRQQGQQRRAELDSQIAQERSVVAQVTAIEEQIRIRTATFEKGYTSRVILLEQQRELARINTQLAELQGQIIRSRESIAEVDARIAELRARNQLDATQEIGKVTNDLAEIRETIDKAQDRFKRLTIRSPVRGIVKGLQTETIGGVIAPGSTILEVIPIDAQLIVEARVLTKDIGFVHAGQQALIKVATYDYTRFGGINGQIDTISATTFQDDKGNGFYRARIRLEKNHVGDDPARNLVIPGMTVLADIRTGDKTVLAYLLKPIVRASSEALRER